MNGITDFLMLQRRTRAAREKKEVMMKMAFRAAYYSRRFAAADVIRAHVRSFSLRAPLARMNAQVLQKKAGR